MKKNRQPTHKKGAKYGYQEFIVQELPDPESVLSDEQKTWPRCSTWKPYEPPAEAKPAEQPPQPAE